MYGNLKVHKFLSKCAHLVVEAESVFARVGCCEDEVALSLLLPIHNDLVIRSNYLIIDVERSSSLDLFTINV